jgi:hypothetical protein
MLWIQEEVFGATVFDHFAKQHENTKLPAGT